MEAAVVEKCLAFCQGLVMEKHQLSFQFSLKKDTFDFNNKELVNSFCLMKKKKSPSQARREERRKIERNEKITKDATVKVTEVTESTSFKCAECDMQFGTEKGLKIHIGRAHKLLSASTPEKERRDSVIEESPLTLTPVIGIREESSGKVDTEELESMLTNEVCDDVSRNSNLDRSVNDPEIKIPNPKDPNEVELCPVCKFDRNYCPLSPGCPMETVIYPKKMSSRKKRK